MGKKKICMIVYAIYSTDNRVRREAETLTACGSFEVTVLCLKENTNARSYKRDEVNVKELNLRKYVGHRTLLYFISYAVFLIKAFLACTLLFLRRKIDIVHVHNMPNALVLAAIVPKLYGKKVILDMHESMPDMYKAKFTGNANLLYKLLCIEEKLSAWISDRVICVNHVQMEITVRRGIPSKKIHIFMNVPDHKRFVIQNKRKSRKTYNKFKLVYHGTISERHGIDLAFETVVALKKQIPGVELHLWGRGDSLNVLRYKKVTSVSNEVIIHGPVPIEQIPEAISDMDLGVIPNRKNCATDLMLPVKMMEYMALGIPVVAPKLKAIQYYFSDKMLSYYEPENTKAMAEAILEIYQDASRRKSQVEKAKGFLKRYGWEKQSVDFINFYLGM